MQQLAAVPQRNRARLIHVNTAHRIAHQPPSSGRCRNPLGGVRRFWCGGLAIPQHSPNDIAHQPQSPGKDQQPEQKSHDARKKVHLI